MTVYDQSWVAAEEAKRRWMDENGLYKAEDEHASCGVGLVVSINGKPSRRVVEMGIEALKAVWHRGAQWTPMARPATARAFIWKSRRMPSSPISRPQCTGDKSAPGRGDRRGPGLPAASTDFGAQETLPDQIVETEDPSHGLLASMAGAMCPSTRAGASARRRTPPAPRSSRSSFRTPELRGRGDRWSATSMSSAGASRRQADRGADPRAVSLLAVQPVHHLQGDVPGRGRWPTFYPDLHG
jgi:hypothetical protein